MSSSHRQFDFQVVHSQGTKSIALRSNYKIVNETPFSIEVFIETATEGVAPYLLTIGTSLSLSLSPCTFSEIFQRNSSLC
jgi:hypothetical protein